MRGSWVGFYVMSFESVLRWLYLGFDKSAHPVQVTPRKVPQLDVPVVGIALTVSLATIFITKYTKAL